MVIERFARTLLKRTPQSRWYAQHAKVAFLVAGKPVEAYDAELEFHRPRIPEERMDFEMELAVMRYASDFLRSYLPGPMTWDYPHVTLPALARDPKLMQTHRQEARVRPLNETTPMEHWLSQAPAMPKHPTEHHFLLKKLWNDEFDSETTALARKIQPGLLKNLKAQLSIIHGDPDYAEFFQRVHEEISQAFSAEYFPTLMHALRLQGLKQQKP